MVARPMGESVAGMVAARSVETAELLAAMSRDKLNCCQIGSVFSCGAKGWPPTG